MDLLGKSSMKSSSLFQKCLHSFLLRKLTQLWFYRWFPKVTSRQQTWAHSAEDAVTFAVFSFLWLQVDGTNDDDGTCVGTTSLLMRNLADADDEGGTFLPAGIGETLTPFRLATGNKGWGCSEWNWFPTGNGNPLPYSCLGNTMDRRAWRATVHGAATEHACSKEQPHVAQSLENMRMVIRCGFVSMKIECPCVSLFVWLWICVCGGVPVSSGAISHSHSMIHLSRFCKKKKKISSPLLTVCIVTHSSFTQLLLEIRIIFSLLGWIWGRR